MDFAMAAAKAREKLHGIFSVKSHLFIGDFRRDSIVSKNFSSR